MAEEKSPVKAAVMSVILIDKPKGWTSFDAVERVSNILGVKKAGHSGTLDPNATGLLLIALGEARKAMPVLFGLDKEYVGTMRLHCDSEKAKIEKALSSFIGEITQTPPVRSAVARRPRKRKVYEMELLGAEGRDVKFRVLCEAGTYIRKIAHDAGEMLSCGAHLTRLRRTKVGPFRIEEALTIEQLEELPKSKIKGALIPLGEVFKRLKVPMITVKNEHVEKIRNGSPVRNNFMEKSPKGTKEGGYCAVCDEKGGIVCLGRFVSKEDAPIKTERVFLQQ